MKRKPRLLILECTSESREKMSEGMLLWELMRILGFGRRTKFLSIENKDSFFRKLEGVQESYLHISAHGDFDPAKGTRIDLPRKAKVYSSDLVDLWNNKTRFKIPKLVVLSACETGHVDMVRAFSDAGCQYCVAPLHETSWEDAAVFSTLLYKLLIGEGMSPWVSFKKSISISDILPRLSGIWSFYEWGEKVVIE
jgi:hypothetical protein